MIRKSLVSALAGSSRATWWPIVQEPFTGAWQQDGSISQEDQLSSPVVYSCITLIANDIGKLQPRIVKKTSEGIWEEIDQNHPNWRALKKPNRYQNHIQFKQWWITSKLRSGNAYALKERDARGMVKSLYLLDPSRVTPLITDDGEVYYELMQDNLSRIKQSSVIVPASEIIHDRMNCLYHPLVGMSPLHAAAIAAGIGIKIQNNTLHFFGNQSRPSGILVAPGAISKETADMMKTKWQENYNGSGFGGTAVLADGLRFEPVSTKAVDSQLIETLRWSDERVCSVFHVPSYKVGVGAPPSYNNIEALDRAYYSECLQSLIEEMEIALDDGMEMDTFSMGVELDLNGLMRMDSKTQMETIEAGIRAKALTINDARLRLNQKPLDGGDTVYMQQQDYPLDVIKNNELAAKQEPAAPVIPAKEPEEDETDKAVSAMLLRVMR